MTFEESIPLAKQLAENELKKGFDVEAFLILAEIQKMNVDTIPESSVDETIQDVNGLFANYFHTRSLDSLGNLLNTIKRMLSEMYHTCSTQEERTLFIKAFEDISVIYKPTNI